MGLVRERSVDGRGDFHRVKWLGDEARGARFQGLSNEPVAVERADDENPGRGPPLSHHRQRLHPAQTGHEEVEQHQLRRALSQDLERLAAVFRFEKRMASAFENIPQDAADKSIVVDNEDGGHSGDLRAGESPVNPRSTYSLRPLYSSGTASLSELRRRRHPGRSTPPRAHIH